SNFYARAGAVYLNNGTLGSVTFIGTVSPAGGNLKEPVTESTKKAARCFYALAQGRADSKRYPAIDPIDSYSKYLEYDEIINYLNDKVGKGWVDKIFEGKNIVLRGKEAYEQINILGDDGVPMDYHLRFWRSELIDFAVLQQDAFDEIDSTCPMDRQRYMFDRVMDLCQQNFVFEHFEECANFFKQLINICKQMNYSDYESDNFFQYEKELEAAVSKQLKKD
ncbi:MAG: V-type ATP synthase subunit A, partial [Bacteroidales bacterium]|nr:V-type ATP synthase subunit A [Bacteroidales bacterium]